MFKPQDGIGEHGEAVPGPPWILGHRGAPRETPENTLVALRRAIELGCDGFEYDLHACASGEAVLIHDATLERTTDHEGPVASLTLPELAGVDAGGWFHKRFAGEPLPLLAEALELDGPRAGERPMHMIEAKDPAVVRAVARRRVELGRDLSVRLASFDRGACLEARDLGLPAMLLAVEASEDGRRFVRDERLAAYGVGPGGWRTPAGRAEWGCEVWGWSVDDPEDLLEACRRPFFGLNTNEPLRALATRALVHLAPEDEGRYPVQAPELEVEPDPVSGGAHGAWSGRWSPVAGVRNPFSFDVEVAVAPLVRGGAFEVEGLPVALRLAPGEAADLPFRIAGGSWSPGDDPRLIARFAWKRGPGRPAGHLVLDAPLARIRGVNLGREAIRLPMLREHPGEREASVTVRRRGAELLCRVEDPGGLDDARALVRLGRHTRRGGRGVRIRLPEDFDRRVEGVPFSCGFDAWPREGGARVRRVRRWAGGIPGGIANGAPGRLFPAAGA